MLIVVISSLTSYSTAGYLIKALSQSGHEVFAISDKRHTLAQVNVQGSFVLSEILNKHEINPNLVIFIEGGSMQLFPQGLNDIKCLTAWYGIDTHMNYEKHLRISRLFDVTLVAQKEYVIRLISDGIRQVIWLPLGFEPSLHPSVELERIYDIGYVGSNNAQMHPARHRMLGALEKFFPKMWSGMATPQEMGKIYAQSKLVFNKSVNNDLNMRYFEAMGAGAVLITDPILANGLEDLFIEGEHFLSYKNEENLLQIIDGLLKEPERIQSLGRAARKVVIERHTYHIRAIEMIKILKSCTKLKQPSKLDIFTALLSMRLLAPALKYLAIYLKTQEGGRASLVTYRMAASVITATAILIYGIDWLKRLLKS